MNAFQFEVYKELKRLIIIQSKIPDSSSYKKGLQGAKIADYIENIKKVFLKRYDYKITALELSEILKKADSEAYATTGGF